MKCGFQVVRVKWHAYILKPLGEHVLLIHSSNMFAKPDRIHLSSIIL